MIFEAPVPNTFHKMAAAPQPEENSKKQRNVD
jgi:hypothetical protein